jgi:uncharacterized membrane protein
VRLCLIFTGNKMLPGPGDQEIFFAFIITIVTDIVIKRQTNYTTITIHHEGFFCLAPHALVHSLRVSLYVKSTNVLLKRSTNISHAKTTLLLWTPTDKRSQARFSLMWKLKAERKEGLSWDYSVTMSPRRPITL